MTTTEQVNKFCLIIHRYTSFLDNKRRPFSTLLDLNLSIVMRAMPSERIFHACVNKLPGLVKQQQVPLTAWYVYLFGPNTISKQFQPKKEVYKVGHSLICAQRVMGSYLWLGSMFRYPRWPHFLFRSSERAYWVVAVPMRGPTRGNWRISGTAPMKKSALKKENVAGHDHDGTRRERERERASLLGGLVQPF